MNYKIGSFNMRRFGMNAQKDFEKIAEIITGEDLDIVALQEIFSEGKGVETMLKQWVKYELYNWDCSFASPQESRDLEKVKDMLENTSRGEGYAYLWNAKKFKIVEYSKNGIERKFEPRIVSKNDAGIDCTFYARAPYYIRLQPLYGGFFEIRLINIHVYFGDQSLSSIEKRRIEYEMLAKEIYPNIGTRAYGQNRIPYTIAMGDYNLNIFNPCVPTKYHNAYLQPRYQYNDTNRSVNIITVQDQLTTLQKKENSASFANNFDHFTYSPELSPFVSVSYNAIDAINKYCNGDFEYYLKNISDHLPIVMNVEI